MNTTETAGPAEGYAATGYDEMWDDGKVRPHWQSLIARIQSAAPSEVERWTQEARRHLRENGVTYSILEDPSSTHRPWQLDMVPFVIDADDWRRIEAGVVQRAELMNRILLDIYGEGRLVREGLLPAALVHSHAGYLRACDGIHKNDDRPLRFYAADLARGADGRMWVLRDRTQVPYGIGYALENRTVISQVVPDLIRSVGVRRLAGFFRSYMAGIESISGVARPGARTVFLTPGPASDQYFEHTYLADYLGFPLIQGADLTVRDGSVRLKTVEGLKSVDTIVRGINDRFCDPLELTFESGYGVPGLLDAIRRGTVNVINTPGCAILENPGLVPFLPGIARELLGEDLILDSATTWWCGQPRELDYVLSNLDRLAIGLINSGEDTNLMFGPDTSEAERDVLKARIAADPHLYIGQEIKTFSTVPALHEGRLEPRHAVLTAFAADRDRTYAVMPGGLTRTAPDPASRVVSRRGAVVSKDTWVLGHEREPYVSLWLDATAGAESPAGSTLPSRAAENLFWVGRYAERAEGLARLMRLIVRHLGNRDASEDPAQGACLSRLVHVLATMINPVTGSDAADEREPENELLDIVVNVDRPGSLSSTLRSLSRAAYATRGLWSADSWRVIEGLDDHWPDPGTTYLNPGILRNRLNQLMTGLSAFGGLNQESMTRELGWHILDIGRRIERGLLELGLLSGTLVERHEQAVTMLMLESVLVASESLMTYRRRNRGVLQLPAVLELLLFDPTNPRSVAHQFGRLEEHFRTLPYRDGSHRLSAHEKLVVEAHTRLRVSDPESLVPARSTGSTRRRLGKLLDHCERALTRTSDAISDAYFLHTETSRRLSGPHDS